MAGTHSRNSHWLRHVGLLQSIFAPFLTVPDVTELFCVAERAGYLLRAIMVLITYTSTTGLHSLILSILRPLSLPHLEGGPPNLQVIQVLCSKMWQTDGPQSTSMSALSWICSSFQAAARSFAADLHCIWPSISDAAMVDIRHSNLHLRWWEQAPWQCTPQPCKSLSQICTNYSTSKELENEAKHGCCWQDAILRV